MGRPRKDETGQPEVVAQFREVAPRATQEIRAEIKSAYIPQYEAVQDQPMAAREKRQIPLYQVIVNGRLFEWTAGQIEVALKDKRMKIELPPDYVVSNEVRPCKNC